MPTLNRSHPHYDPGAYKGLEICILSGQIPQEEVPHLMEINPAFASWYYEQRHIAPRVCAL